MKRLLVDIFLNNKKNCYQVNYELLIRNLDYCGIRGVALDLMKSFFSNRYQAN